MSSWGRLSEEAKLAHARQEMAFLAAREAMLLEMTIGATSGEQWPSRRCMSHFGAYGDVCPRRDLCEGVGECLRVARRSDAVLRARAAIADLRRG